MELKKVYVTIRIDVEIDDNDNLNDFLNDMNYDFNDGSNPHGKIKDAEILEFTDEEDNII